MREGFSYTPALVPMKILIADDSPISSRMIEFLVESTGHECCVAHDGDRAWEIISAGAPPKIMFLDWMMPGVDGLELCRRVRELHTSYYIYIVVISARQTPGDLRLGYQAGADDFITKPFRRQDILSRLRAAERVVQALSPVSILEAVQEACDGAGGDIIIRSGDVVGRIMIHNGSVAWAHISSSSGSLVAVLGSGEEPSLDQESIREVLKECSATGRNFAEVIIDWGLLDADTLRELVRSWLRDRIREMSLLPAPRIIFTPEDRSYGDGLLFDIGEVFPTQFLYPPPVLGCEPSGGLILEPFVAVSEESRRAMLESLDRIMAIDGALSVAILDSGSGEVLAHRGELGDHEIAWSNLKLAASASAADPVEDIIINTKSCVHILRVYARSPSRFIFLTASRSAVRLGMLRLALADCCAGAVGESE